MENDEGNTPQQQQEEGETDTSGKRKTPVNPTPRFLSQTPAGKHKDARLSASCTKFNANWRNSNWKQKTTQKNQTSQKTYVELNLERYAKNVPLSPRNFRVKILFVGNCRSSSIILELKLMDGLICKLLRPFLLA